MKKKEMLAAFGSPLARQIDVLREFRNAYLLTNIPGKAFVRWYYTYGQIAGKFINTHPVLKLPVRIALYPLIGVAYLSVHKLLLFVGLLILGLYLLRYRKVMVKK